MTPPIVPDLADQFDTRYFDNFEDEDSEGEGEISLV